MDNDAANYGGGIANDAGTLTVTDSTIDNNSVYDGKYGGGGIDNAGTLTVTNSTIANNSRAAVLTAMAAAAVSQRRAR